VGYRDRGDKARDGRERRPPSANRSSAAEFGDDTIDRPTPLDGRRARAGGVADRTPLRVDRPTRSARSDTAGWSTITPIEAEPETDRTFDDELDLRSGRGEPWPTESRRRGPVDDIDDRPRRQRDYPDDDAGRRYPPETRRAYDGRADQDSWSYEPETRRSRRAADSPRWTDDLPPDDDNIARRGPADPGRVPGDRVPGDRVPGDRVPGRRVAAGWSADERAAGVDEPRRSRRPPEEAPRRSRRAVEESDRRARRDDDSRGRPSRIDADNGGGIGIGEPRRVARLDADDPLRQPRLGRDDEPRRRPADDEVRRGWRPAEDDELPRRRRSASDDPPRRTRPADSEPRLARGTFDPDDVRDERRARRSRSDVDAGVWRARETTDYDVRRPVEDVRRPVEPDAGRLRPDGGGSRNGTPRNGSSRTHETIEVDLTDVGLPGQRGVDSGSTFNGFAARNLGQRAIGSSPAETGSQTGRTGRSELDARRTDTGTWRTRGTAETGSWRTPLVPPDTESGGSGDIGARRTRSTPEAGSWSRSRGQFIPETGDTGEQPNFTVRPFDDTGEIPKELVRRLRDERVVDHGSAYGAGDRYETTGLRDAPGRRGDSARREQRATRDDIDTRASRDDIDTRASRDGLDDRGVERRRRPVAGNPADDRDDPASGRGRRRRADRDERDGFESRPRESRGPRDDRVVRWERDPGVRDDRAEERLDRTAEWAPPADTRRPRRALPTRSDDRYDEPRPRYARDDEDAPRYRAAGRAAVESRGTGYSSGWYDDDDRLPVRGAGRRGATGYSGRRDGQTVITTRSGGTRGDLSRQMRRPDDYDDDDGDVEDVAYGYAGAGVASVAWFGLPLGAFLLWALLLGGTARADCVDAAGRACPAPRDAAFTTFTVHLPQFVVAIVLSVVVGLLIRRVSPFWKAATVGFAASVVGAGVTTVLFTVLNSGAG
jgi:hypothetical protein